MGENGFKGLGVSWTDDTGGVLTEVGGTDCESGSTIGVDDKDVTDTLCAADFSCAVAVKMAAWDARVNFGFLITIKKKHLSGHVQQ